MEKTDSILDEIVAYTKKQLIEKKKQKPLHSFEKKVNADGIRDLKKALLKDRISLIAEIKKQSPSAGKMRKEFTVASIAIEYEKANVDAISVLTEPKYFQGDMSFIPKIKEIASVPILRKDFIIDPYQIYESRLFGADAFLLIARLFSKNELQQVYTLGKSLGMQMLVEIRTEDDLELALEINAEIIGINNRDLKTFTEDLSIFEKLAVRVPKEKILVAESAIKTREDVKRVEKAGANAMLVGTTLMKSENIYKTVKELRWNI